jgi:hypothetical protein
MATPIHRPSTAQKRTCKQDYHAQGAHIAHVRTHDDRKAHECPEGKVRRAARMVVGDELDFVFRL